MSRETVHVIRRVERFVRLAPCFQRESTLMGFMTRALLVINLFVLREVARGQAAKYSAQNGQGKDKPSSSRCVERVGGRRSIKYIYLLAADAALGKACRRVFRLGSLI